jgi:hypothetical protein
MEQKVESSAELDIGRDLSDYYTRWGLLYRVYFHWVLINLTRWDFELILLKHGFTLNAAGEPRAVF